ncbi:hypothetical protein [Alteromonas macleodii]|uniref:hypothetical protein n=1 Tax=Alteromonas macleodii TaxID=28108 RepID=UPI001930C1AB|nr:hypothetical protein [Alteromonas macleodii]
MKIIIHVGPSKTGTSAIQNWLSSHQKNLLELGIYYPPHRVDINGISSGNLLQVFDRDGDELIVNNQKVQDVLTKASLNKCDRLLLSSEFFSEHIDALIGAFGSVEVIAYLRYPLEFTQSSYNQSIKRHRQTNRFGIRMKPQAFNLERLEKICNKLANNSYQIRPYHKECFEGGNLIADFCQALGIYDSVSYMIGDGKGSRQINTSYTIENLEFKRWFNQFNLANHAKTLDTFLQSESQTGEQYSLVKPELFEIVKSHFNELIKEFAKKYKVYNVERFIQVCQNLSPNPYKEQFLSENDFKVIADKFLSARDVDQLTLFTLYMNDWKKMDNIERPEFLDIFGSRFSLNIRFRFYIKAMYRRMKKLFRLLLLKTTS